MHLIAINVVLCVLSVHIYEFGNDLFLYLNGHTTRYDFGIADKFV